MSVRLSMRPTLSGYGPLVSCYCSPQSRNRDNDDSQQLCNCNCFYDNLKLKAGKYLILLKFCFCTLETFPNVSVCSHICCCLMSNDSNSLQSEVKKTTEDPLLTQLIPHYFSDQTACG